MNKYAKWVFLSMIFIILYTAFFVGAFAEDSGTCGTHLTWLLDDKGTLTISGNGTMTNYTSSSSSPWGNGVVAAVIEQGVTSIGDNAFYNCNSLTTISISDSVASIGSSAFYNCSSLSNISFPENLITIDNYAFCNCSSLIDSAFPDSLNIIGYKAFYNCQNLSSISFPKFMISIGDYAFSKCGNLIDVAIPKGITSISNRLFFDCVQLKDVFLPDGVLSIGDYAFSGCGQLSDITLPDTLNNLGEWAFYGCSSLQEISIPGQLEEIQDFTFYSCKSLKKVDLLADISCIGEGAFMGCKVLEKLVIPDSVDTIERNAFTYCDNLVIQCPLNSNQAILLKSINFSRIESPNALGFCFQFYGKDSNVLYLTKYTGTDDEVEVPHIVDGYIVTSIGSSVFKSCSSLKTIILPDTIETVGESAFWGCTSLSSVFLPNGLAEIGASVFYGCRSLETLVLPDSLLEIPSSAFYGCINLTRVKIPKELESIGSSAFWGCAIEEIEFPRTLQTIGSSAFRSCNNLKEFYIPECVSSIAASTFNSCVCLSRVYIHDGITSIASNAFQYCDNVCFICNLDSPVVSVIQTVLTGHLASPEAMDFWVTKQNSASAHGIQIDKYVGANIDVIVPRKIDGISVISIGESCFNNSPYITSITIPESVNNIGNYAFNQCGMLSKICLLSENIRIGNGIIRNKPTVFCYEYSDVECWAVEKGYPVVLLDTLDIDLIRTVSLPDDIRLEVGNTYKPCINIFPNHDSPEVRFSNSNPQVVEIENGVITGLSCGVSTITAQIGSVSDSMDIYVYAPIESFELDKKEEWIVAKQSIQFSIVNIKPNGADAVFTWNSSDTTLASVDENGLVTTKKPGDVIITATSENGLTSDCLVHLCYPVTSIDFQPSVLTIKTNRSAELTANVTMRTQNCVNRLVTFSSSDEAIATVDENGIVTGHNVGTTIITATAESGVTGMCTVIVREMNTLTLPSYLTTIDSEAFSNLISVDAIRIPVGVTSIADDAFDGSDIILYVRSGSYAAEWAENHGFEVIVE